MTQQPPEDPGERHPPPLQPFVLPGPQPADSPPGGNGNGQAATSQPGAGYGQPAAGYGQPQQAYQPYPRGAAGQQRDPALAEWWQRLTARVIDGVAVALLTVPLWVTAFLPLWRRLSALAGQPYAGPAAQQAYTASVNQTVTSMSGTILLIAAATAAIKFGYDWLQHGLWGQTLGKRALGTKVVMSGTRAPVTGRAACIRAAVYALAGGLPYAGVFWWAIDCLWLLWDPQRQCLHDKAARTLVVKKAALDAAARPGGW